MGFGIPHHPKERGISRVHDRIHSLPGNVALYNLNAFDHGIVRSEPAGHARFVGAAGQGIINSAEGTIHPAHIPDIGILLVKHIVNPGKGFCPKNKLTSVPSMQ